MPLADIKAATSDFNIQSAPADDDASPPRKKSPVQVQSNDTNQSPVQSNASNTTNAATKPSGNKKWYNGFAFTLHKRLKNGSRLRCSSFRSEPECTAVLKEFDDGTTAFTGKHAPGCLRRNGKQVPLPSTSSNCSDQMHQWVEQRATHPDHLHDPADLIWRDCVAHFTEVIGPNFNGLDKSQIRNLVYHSREKTFGSNAIAKVESQYSGPSATAFLCCNTTFTDEKKMQRMMCFALPALLNLLMYPMVRIKAPVKMIKLWQAIHSFLY